MNSARFYTKIGKIRMFISFITSSYVFIATNRENQLKQATCYFIFTDRTLKDAEYFYTCLPVSLQDGRGHGTGVPSLPLSASLLCPRPPGRLLQSHRRTTLLLFTRSSSNHRQMQLALKSMRGLTPRTSEASWLQTNSRPYCQLELAIISNNVKGKYDSQSRKGLSRVSHTSLSMALDSHRRVTPLY